MKKLLNRQIAIVAVAVIATVAFFSFKSGDDRNFQIAKNLDIFNAIVKELDMFYVDTIDPNKTIREGIDNMLYTLDPYTEYFPEEDQSELEQMIKGSFGGMGSYIAYNTKLKRSMISEPFEGTPAAKAGLQEGDIITAVNGRAIDDSVDMPVIIGSMAPGSIAKLSIIRNNKDMTLDVKVEEAPNESASSNASKTAAANKLGVTVRPLNDEEKAKAETEGLLVTESTGAARKAGIREGDIIVNVNGVKIKKTDDLARVLEKNKNLRVLVQRRDGRIFIPVRLK